MLTLSINPTIIYGVKMGFGKYFKGFDLQKFLDFPKGILSPGRFVFWLSSCLNLKSSAGLPRAFDICPVGSTNSFLANWRRKFCLCKIAPNIASVVF